MSSTLKKVFVLSLGVKLLVALFIPLTLDEYYYFLWGNKLSLSYFDHPPMVGWLMVFSQPLKAIAEGCIRWPFLLLSHATIFIWYRILKDELSEKKLFYFTLVALLNPLWGLGALIATPDIPLLFTWSLALLFYKRLLHQAKISNYLMFGLALGLGFLSKYQIALFLPALAWGVIQQKAYKQVFTIKTLFSIVVALGFCFPVFYWNYTHDWASFDFQWNHGMSSRYWKWILPFEYVFSQIFIIFPAFLLFLRKKESYRHWLMPFALFPLMFFFYSSFKSRVEANWVIMSLPSVYALALIFAQTKTLKWQKRSIVLWSGVLAVAFVLIQVKSPLIKKTKIFEREKFLPILTQMQSQETYFTYSYQMSGFLSFYRPQMVCKFPKYGRIDHFNYMPECLDFPKQFTIINQSYENWPLQQDFPDLQKVSETPINESFKFEKVVHK